MSGFTLDRPLGELTNRVRRLELAVARNKPAAGVDFNDDGGSFGGGTITLAEILAAIGAGTLPTSFLTVIGGGKGTVQSLGNLGATETIDLANANLFLGTLNADCTIGFTGWTNGKDCQITVILTEDGTGGWTPTFTGVTWDGTTPIHGTTAGTFTRYVFTSSDGGTTIIGAKTGAGATVGGLPWFNVQDYGAIEDNTTDCQGDVNDAIAAMIAAGGGVLYFPGTGVGYLTTGAFDAITVPGIVMGDGIAATVINCSSATANLFTSASAVRAPAFRDMLLVTSHATPTAGSLINVASGGNSSEIANCRFEGAWTGVRHQDGAGWSIHHNTFNGIRKYGVDFSNAGTPDEGDSSIHDNIFADSGDSPDDAIHGVSSGGPRIHDNKIVGSGASTGYNHGISFDIAGTDQTSILKISGNSIERVRGDGIHITQAGTATLSQISVVDNQINLIGNNAGKAVSIVAEDTGAIEHILIKANTFSTDGTARTPIALTKVNNAYIRGNLLCENFEGQQPFTNSASTAVAAYYPDAQIQKTNITAAVTITGTTEGAATTVITGASLTCDGVTALAFNIYAPYLAAPAVAGGFLAVVLLEDTTVIAQMGMVLNSAGAALRVPYYASINRTPAAGVHTYVVKAFRDSSGTGTASFHAGAGGTGAHAPAFLKINVVSAT